MVVSGASVVVTGEAPVVTGGASVVVVVGGTKAEEAVENESE